MSLRFAEQILRQLRTEPSVPIVIFPHRLHLTALEDWLRQPPAIRDAELRAANDADASSSSPSVDEVTTPSRRRKRGRGRIPAVDCIAATQEASAGPGPPPRGALTPGPSQATEGRGDPPIVGRAATTSPGRAPRDIVRAASPVRVHSIASAATTATDYRTEALGDECTADASVAATGVPHLIGNLRFTTSPGRVPVKIFRGSRSGQQRR